MRACTPPLSLTPSPVLGLRARPDGAPAQPPQQAPPPPWYGTWGGFPFGLWTPNPAAPSDLGSEPNLGQSPGYSAVQNARQIPRPERGSEWWARQAGRVPGAAPHQGQHTDDDDSAMNRPADVFRPAAGERDRPGYTPAARPRVPFPPSARAPVFSPPRELHMDPLSLQEQVAFHNTAPAAAGTLQALAHTLHLLPQHVPPPPDPSHIGDPDQLFALLDRFQQGDSGAPAVPAAAHAAADVVAPAVATPPGLYRAQDFNQLPIQHQSPIQPVHTTQERAPAPTEMPPALRAAFMDAGLVSPYWSTLRNQEVC